MATQDGLLILHLSDLHFGNHNRFADRDLDKLGKAFFRAIEHARTGAGVQPKIQMVIVSGDLVEVGKGKEFEQAEVFLNSLSGEIGLDHTRFVFAPGNHDLSWPLCKKVAADQEIEEFDEAELRRRMDAVKFQFYDAMLARIYGKPLNEVPGRQELACGGWLHDFPELRLSVAALNTSELESHRSADHRGYLSLRQAEALMDTWRRDPYPRWIKIVVVHHNPIATTPPNIQDWARFMKTQPDLATERIDRYAADVVGFEGRDLLERIVRGCRAHLVLHGHHHDQGDPIEWPWSKEDGRAPVLSTGSWGLIDGKLPGDAPPACQLLLLTPDSGLPRLDAFPLVYNGRFRMEGDLLPGNFIADPAQRGRYSQPLSLPTGWPRLQLTHPGLPRKPKSAPRRTKASRVPRRVRDAMTFQEKTANSIGMQLKLIPDGDFLMGSLDTDRWASANEKPRHQVRIKKPFYLGVYPVTQRQFQQVIGTNPSHFEGNLECPVECVSWMDAVEFCRKLSEEEGRVYRLPSEAEWEYACRAGTKTRFNFADEDELLGEYAWFEINSDARTHPVGQKKPNAWGLYDMHGNVWEWCEDWFEEEYYTSSAKEDPLGTSQATDRVFRGGSWRHSSRDCRSACRDGHQPTDRFAILGFRVAAVP